MLLLQTLWKPEEQISVGHLNAVGKRPKGRRNLISSCLESHFDFAIKTCESLHQPVVEIGHTSL